MKRAFTLIELLVVIAIIAILAAILFPVFAQAKVAAKKASSISNVKQVGTCTAIYLADSDDMMPLATGYHPTIGWLWDYWIDVPSDWRTTSATYQAYMEPSVSNATRPYRKNEDLLTLAGVSSQFLPFGNATGLKAPTKVGLAYNGLLHSYSHTAVNAPSSLPMFTQIGGILNAVGAETGPLPYPDCYTTSGACRYVPANGNTCGSGAGHWSYFYYPNASQWIYGRAQTWVMTDTSARARNVGMNVGGRTDFRTDAYTNYRANGVDNNTAWYDGGYCHALLFRPDFDFQTWPTNPVAGY
jgi:prepilin-type N-terminal cleavage/methylation domain-containing protein